MTVSIICLPAPDKAAERLWSASLERGFVYLSGAGWGHDRALIGCHPRTVLSGHASIDAILARWRAATPDATPFRASVLPGWLGWLGYPDANGELDYWLGWFPTVVELSDDACLLHSLDGDFSDILLALDVEPPASTPFHLGSPFQPDRTKAQYTAAFDAITEYIRAGDCYQVNFAQRFRAAHTGDLFPAHLRMCEAMQAPFAGFVQCGDHVVMSHSPESFLSVKDGQVRTRPIKGTRPRGASPGEDDRLRDALASSPKDRAENVMIVDLLRNDLGKIAVTGSVTVDTLFGIETHTHVHHMVSTVSARLDDHYDAFDVIGACYPGGSITGAPKRRAMEIIAELEGVARGAYCGSLLHLSAGGMLSSNLMIRTFEGRGGDLTCWGGGGIVADSNADDEYAETLHKIGRLMALLSADPV